MDRRRILPWFIGGVLLLFNGITSSAERRDGDGSTSSSGSSSHSVHYFVEEPKSAIAFEGTTIVLRCAVNDRSNIQFYWAKDKSYLTNTSRSYEEKGFLTILRLEKADQGTYECIASNLRTGKVIFSRSAKLILKSTQSADSSTSEIDLLKAIGVPTDSSIEYSYGVDGYPAFHLRSTAEIKRSSFEFFGARLPSDFAIVILTRPDSVRGGYLFTVVSPDAIISFGLLLTNYGGSSQNLVLYYTENSHSRDESYAIANFTVPSLAGQWSKIAIKVIHNVVTLYLNCDEYDKTYIKRSKQGLEFDAGSKLYIGQAGAKFGSKFLGSFQELKIYSDPIEAEDKDSCEDLIQGSGSGYDGLTDELDPDDGYRLERPSSTIKGQKGEVGPQGTHGEKGDQGAQGVAGKPAPPPMITPPPPDIDDLKGPKGDSGDRGFAGRPGEVGIPGLPGQKGDKGEAGVPGLKGLGGDTGQKGDEGQPGIAGNPGLTIQGPKGERGPPGLAHTTDPRGGGVFSDTPGEKGMKGEVGDIGLPGVAGISGRPGVDGHHGRDGLDGLPGQTGHKGDSMIGPQGLVGPPGPPGPAGPRGSAGVAVFSDDEEESSGYIGIDSKPDRTYVGDPGPPGQMGLIGPAGPDGRPGVPGRDGERGPRGITGPPGIPGEGGSTAGIGRTGPMGPPGLPGQPGVDGVNGNAGQRGSKGDRGDGGELGPQGYSGQKGERGLIGPVGTAGQDGRAGPPGPPGPPGGKIIGGVINVDDDDNEGSGDVLAGLPGPPGPRGFQGGTGPTGPQGTAGIPGDRGEQGYPGTRGLKGDRGDIGEAGYQGERGLPGVAGQPGLPGSPGAVGQDGRNGIKGEAGYGIQGPPGPPGIVTTTGDHGDIDIVTKKGQKGDRGMMGLPGDVGMTGSVGLPGDPGEPGLVGPIGPHGGRGERGYPGPPGPPGNAVYNGYAGSGEVDGYSQKGEKGATGEMGPVGHCEACVGEKGERGHEGMMGKPGPHGSVGPRGVRGPSGQIGMPGFPGRSGWRGRKGQSGVSITGAKGEPGTGFDQPASVSVPGSKGEKGSEGRVGMRGPQGPPGPGSSRRDDYGRTIEGPKGEAGSSGPAGRDGLRGIPGLGGQKGESGRDGRDGTPGLPGQIIGDRDGGGGVAGGLPGPRGPPGPPGIGEKGQDGMIGRPGRGYPGPQGPQGPPGPIGPPGLSSGRTDTGTSYGRGDPGPPGPPGPRGHTEKADGKGISVPGVTTFINQAEMIKLSRSIPIGSIAFLLDQERVFVRVVLGWQYIQLGPLVPLPTPTEPEKWPTRPHRYEPYNRNKPDRHDRRRPDDRDRRRPDDRHRIPYNNRPNITLPSRSGETEVNHQRYSEPTRQNERHQTYEMRRREYEKERNEYLQRLVDYRKQRQLKRKYAILNKQRLNIERLNKILASRDDPTAYNDRVIRRHRHRHHGSRRVDVVQNATKTMKVSDSDAEVTQNKTDDHIVFEMVLTKHTTNQNLNEKTTQEAGHHRDRVNTDKKKQQSPVEQVEDYYSDQPDDTIDSSDHPENYFAPDKGEGYTIKLSRPRSKADHVTGRPEPVGQSQNDLRKQTTSFITPAPISPSTTELASPELPPARHSLLQDGARLRVIALNHPLSGRMQGIRGADYQCYRQARDAGLKGTFRAFLSSLTQDLKSIVHYEVDKTIPIVNLQNEVIFDSWNSIFEGRGAYLDTSIPIYSFDGKNIMLDARWPQKIVWHGADKKGQRMSDKTCRHWHSGNKHKVAYASSLRNGRLLTMEEFSCNNPFIVLCVEITNRKNLRK